MLARSATVASMYVKNALAGGRGKSALCLCLRSLLALGAAIITSCQTAASHKAPASSTAPQEAEKPVPPGLHIDSKTLTFTHPGTGDTFSLHLGEELHQETGGISKVPSYIKDGVRDATSSYYKPTDKSGASYAGAESLYSREEDGDRIMRNTDIQYQPDSRRLLITEDKSDAGPARRYILFTSEPHGGYSVSYLNPGQSVVSKDPRVEFPTLPSAIHLLPGDRAEINGKILRVKDIPHSSHPFSLD